MTSISLQPISKLFILNFRDDIKNIVLSFYLASKQIYNDKYVTVNL